MASRMATISMTRRVSARLSPSNGLSGQQAGSSSTPEDTLYSSCRMMARKVVILWPFVDCSRISAEGGEGRQRG
eukprot:1190330-Prorocentrum_minimum.AAC.4